MKLFAALLILCAPFAAYGADPAPSEIPKADAPQTATTETDETKANAAMPAADETKKEGSSSLKTDGQKTLYTLGYHLGSKLAPFSLTAAELKTVQIGLTDSALAKKPQVDIPAYGPKINDLADSREAKKSEGRKANAAMPAANETKKEGSSSLNTDDQKTLYTLGYYLGSKLAPFSLSASELKTVQIGLTDSVLSKKPQVDIPAYGPKINALAASREAKKSEGRKAKAEVQSDGEAQILSAVRKMKTGKGTFEKRASEMCSMCQKGAALIGTTCECEGWKAKESDNGKWDVGYYYNSTDISGHPYSVHYRWLVDLPNMKIQPRELHTLQLMSSTGSLDELEKILSGVECGSMPCNKVPMDQDLDLPWYRIKKLADGSLQARP